MPKYTFEREIRTTTSEAYVIEVDGEEVARVDLHYAEGTAFATLSVPSDFDDDSVEELIGEIDERLVMSWDPLRDDFIVTVWSGREVGVFSESGDDDDEDDEDLEDENGTGNR
jgi:hypothetical protein